MNRRTKILSAALALAVAFACWQWFRPYEWMPDKAARYHVTYASLKEDHGFCWLDIALDRSGSENHDPTKPVLLTAPESGHEFAPSEVTFRGNGSDTDVDGMLLRFWLEQGELAGPLKLRINDGTLSIRTGHGIPVGAGDSRSFPSNRW